MTTRFANLLFDTASLLSEARGGEDAWRRVNQVAARLGANAVNAGAFLRDTGDIAWMRSSMKPEWLEEYEADALYQVDPLLIAAMQDRLPPKYDVAAHMTGRAGDPRKRQLHGTLLQHGYGHFLGQSWVEGRESKCLVLSCQDDPVHLFGPGTAQAFASVSAMLSYCLQRPDTPGGDGWIFGAEWEALSPPEIDVLCLLASGLAEQDVADRLMLDAAGVARLLSGASRRMRAESGDQALALAMLRGLLPL